MVGEPIKFVAIFGRTDANIEQLNVFGRNLNTVSQICNFHAIFVTDSDCRSKVKTGNVKGDLQLQISTRELAH